MKARPAPTSRDIERMCDMSWRFMCEAMVDSQAVMIIAMARFFGLGRKRTLKFIDFLNNEVKAEFHRYDVDGVFKDKVAEELDSLGVDMSEAYDIESFKEALRKVSAERRNKPTIAEQYEMKRKLEAMREIMK